MEDHAGLGRVGGLDPVRNPAHYTRGKMETWDWIGLGMTDEEYRGWVLGSVLKYLARYQHKQKPLEDLRKARAYLDRLIKTTEDQTLSLET